MRVLAILLAFAIVTATGVFGAMEGTAAPAPQHLVSPRSVEPGAALSSSEAPLPQFEGQLLVEGLDRPTFAVAPGDGRLFVTEKPGTIRVVQDGTILPDPMLDLDDEIPDHRPERGLLAMDLHPGFASNGLVYVHLTDLDGDSRLIEYRISEEDPNLLDPRSARLVLHVDQPGEFHNGGMLQFGPDGYLYVGMGDGDFGESDRNGGDRRNVLGAILRIDVDGARPYTIPADNPYVGTSFAPEIWMSGFRNPWRFFIDDETRSIAIGDVGQFRWEEMQVVSLDAAGLDFGWPTMEGRSCYQADECDSKGFELPDVVFSHADGCAVVAGPIYRGTAIPELEAMVVYADYCTGTVSAYSLVDGVPTRNETLIEAGTYGPIQSLAVDADGEVLMLTELGEIRRLVARNQ